MESKRSKSSARKQGAKKLKIAYITEKEMFLWDNGKKTKIISQYLETYQANVRKIQKRKEWKQKSVTTAMGYDGMLPAITQNSEVERYRITGLTPYGRTKSLIYSIDIEQMGGIFKVNPLDKKELEGHIYHDRGVTIQNPCYNSKNSTLLYSINEVGGQENIAAHNLKKDSTMTLTEGDSVDGYPRWVEGSVDTIVFQSAGIGRGLHGVHAGLSPSVINSLNIKTGEMTELVEYDNFDCLAPIMDCDGSLYFIKRPYKTETHHSGNIFMDILMFPFRIINAIFHFLNIFTMAYSGKPLTSGSNPARNDADPKKVIIHGNLIEAKKIIDDAAKSGGKGLGIVPRSWKLIKLSPDGKEEILSEGVIAFDRTKDGTLICCNGREIYSLDENREKSTLLKERFIEKVYVL